VKATVLPVAAVAVFGETATTTGAGADTVTVAVSLRVVSAALRATTWQVAAAPGAVYTPAVVIDPQPLTSDTDQVTAVFEVLLTVAVNARVWLVRDVAVCGVTTTATGAVAATTTAAVALTVGSAWLVALTWYVPVAPGALYAPAPVIVPPSVSTTAQVTEVSTAPVTVASNCAVPPGTSSALAGYSASATVWAPPLGLGSPTSAALQAESTATAAATRRR
jgi:hypothetical protein